MEDYNKDILLEKWLNHELTDAELQEFKQRPDYAELQKIADQTKKLDFGTYDKEHEYRKLQNKIDIEKGRSMKKSPFVRWIAIAAIFAVILTSTYLLNNTNDVVSHQAATEQLSVALPDDSEVKLNAGAMISYHKNWDDHREVTLGGEAYFNVTKGDTFKVLTESGTVEVLGTQFNVLEKENKLYVTCYEGSVKVTSGNQETILKPTQGVQIVNGVIKTTNSQLSQPYWLQKEYKYVAKSLDIVLSDLAQVYQKELKIPGGDLTSTSFTGSFNSNGLEQALKSVTLPLGMTYEVRMDTIYVFNKN